jgi:hypothetical protein
MHYYAKCVIRYLRKLGSDRNDAVISFVYRRCVFLVDDEIYYALRIADSVVVGRLVAHASGFLLFGRKLIVSENRYLETRISDVDCRSLYVSGENFSEVAVDEQYVHPVDSGPRIDGPVEWICRADGDLVEFISPRRCRKELRFRTFIRAFNSSVEDILLGNNELKKGP